MLNGNKCVSFDEFFVKLKSSQKTWTLNVFVRIEALPAPSEIISTHSVRCNALSSNLYSLIVINDSSVGFA